MMNEFKKSISLILNERLSSPLYGSLVVSWLIWNWKILLVLFFVSEIRLPQNKLDYIVQNMADQNHIIYYPLISTLLLITIIPLFSNGAFWLSLIYDNWKINKKQEVTRSQLLSLEQSIALRSEMNKMELEFNKIIELKDIEIGTLNSNLQELERKIQQVGLTTEKHRKPTKKGGGPSSYGIKDFDEFMSNKKRSKDFEIIAKEIRDKGQFPLNISEELKEYYLVNDLAEEKIGLAGDVYYDLGFKGQGLYRDFVNRKFDAE